MASTTFEIIRNQDKSVTPTESEQVITYDDGYDGLNSVVVGAVSSGYVGSGITRKGAQTYNPSTSDRTIASGQYLTGDQTIKGMNLEHLSVAISEAATLYTPDTGYDGFDEVSVNGVSSMYVGSMVPRKAAASYHAGSTAQTIESDQYLTGDQTIEAIALQSKNVVPGGSAQTVTADNGYDGLSSVIVSGITLQSKSVNPGAAQQVVTNDSGYSGLSSVTVGGAPLQSKNVVLSTDASQTISPDNGYYGLSSVVVPAVSLQSKNVTLSTASQQTITADSGYNGLGAVNVPAVALQSKAVNTSSSDQVIQADSGYDGLSSVTVAAVTIANLAPGAIKKGVTVTVGDANDDDRIASVTGIFGNMLESIASMEDYITCTHEAVSGTLSPGTALTIYLSYDIPVPSGSIFGRCTSWTVKTSTIGISSAYFSMYADVPPNKTSFALILVGKDGCPANTQVSIAANTIQMKMNCKTISVY